MNTAHLFRIAALALAAAPATGAPPSSDAFTQRQED